MTFSLPDSGPADPAHAPFELAAAVRAEGFRALDRLAPPGEDVGLAVSGGSDSTALLHIASAWGNARSRRVEVATVDHGLRPEAAQEALHVQETAGALGLAHATLAWRPPQGAVDQARARKARHRLLADWAASRRLPVVALGHTADDRLETLLMRVRAGSGWYGLASPLPSAASPAWPEGAGLRLIRPILGLSREALRAALRADGQAWIEDPSNTHLRHERIRARRRLASFTPGARQSLLRMGDALLRLRVRTMALARETCDEVVAWTDTGAEAPLAALLALPRETCRRLLDALLMAVGGRATAPRSTALERLMDDLGSIGSGRLTRSLAHVLIETRSGRIVLSREPPRRRSRRMDGVPFRPAVEHGPEQAQLRALALLADPRAEAILRNPDRDPGADMLSFVTSP